MKQVIWVIFIFACWNKIEAGLFTGKTLNTGYTTTQLNARPIQNDVTFWCAKPGSPAFVQVMVNDTSLEVKLNVSRPIGLIIHGYMGKYTDPPYTPMMQDYVNYTESNFCVVDWSFLANFDYTTTVNQMTRVGNYVAVFIQYLNATGNFPISNVRLMGFSLGAHVAGYTGTALKGQLPEIIGLDAAGPNFAGATASKRLDKTDAKFVQCIHTNPTYLGTSYAYGHTDYYPNYSGSLQPGCPNLSDTFENTVCSHARALHLFRASLNRANVFRGYACSSYSTYLSGKCFSNPSDLFGVYSSRLPKGSLYFNTTAVFPYI